MDRRKQQKKERKLTAAEQKRKEMFLEKKAALEAEGFEAHDLTISAVYANVMALVLALPIVLVLWAVFVWKNGHGSISSPMLLGILPAIAAIFWGNLPLFWLSALMILAAGGDLTILWKLFRFRGSKGEVRFLDHPYEAGLVIFERTFSKV